MKKVYSNPQMDIYCTDSEMLTGIDVIRGSQESDNITFVWGDERSI